MVMDDGEVGGCIEARGSLGFRGRARWMCGLWGEGWVSCFSFFDDRFQVRRAGGLDVRRRESFTRRWFLIDVVPYAVMINDCTVAAGPGVEVGVAHVFLYELRVFVCYSLSFCFSLLAVNVFYMFC